MKVVIIGGGPAGLITALSLNKAGYADVAVYELRQGPATIGGAIQLAPNGLRLLRELGLYESALARGCSASLLQLHSTKSDLLVNTDRASPHTTTNDVGFLRILRADFVNVLLEAALSQGISVEYNKKASRVDESDKDATVHFSDGSSATGDLIMGCDGIHSSIRALCVCPEISPVYSGVSTMYAIVPTDKLERDHRDIVPGLHVTLTPRGMFAFSPCTADGDHLYWFFSSSVAVPSEDSREGWEAFGREEVSSCKDTISGILQNAKGPWIARIRDIVAKSDTIKFYPVYTMPSLPTWSSKRCLLLGDAAHAMPPHTGQGTSMALEDAFLLTRLLKDASRPLSEVFRKFEEIRRPRTEKLSKRSSQRGSDRENRGPLAHRAKELAIGFGFWLYRTAHLEKLGWSIIDSGDEVSYNIMEEEI